MPTIKPKWQMSEEDIKLHYITPAITAKWGLDRITMETKITDGRINLRGNLVTREKPKRADYILYINANNPIAIVEAKDNSHSVSHGLQQAMDYAQMLDVPFAYSSNGDGFCEHDFLTGQERQLTLDEFPSPEDLIARFKRGANDGSGLNDDLNGVERPVSFDVPCLDERAEVVHSLAKWKRYALAEYGFRPGQGLVTDMNAIRRDEELDNLHSIYVDQWDWEKVITAKDRTLPFLQETVRDIVDAVCSTADELRWKFPELKAIRLTREPTFITTQELEDLYPDLTPKERENAFTRAHGTVCIMQIGGQLKSGIRHDGRAPDYDDWTLNCDILFWHKALGCALELSSMGIRVDPAAMTRQLEAAGCPERAELPFHKMLLEGKLPLTMGGGIGQSRLCMLLLGKAHIGEVQVSLWDAETKAVCERAGVQLL